MSEAIVMTKKSPFDLTGRTALVTGGNQGRGRAFAFGLAEAGATMAIAGRSAGRNDKPAPDHGGHHLG
jgi:NAD(P)-dependent dehydrogenase (short-subunit alcohol dehydrogenase family)